MLNLHGSAFARNELLSTGPSDGTESSDNTTSLLFTSRISMPHHLFSTATATAWDPEASQLHRESAYVRAPGGEGYVGEVYPMQDMHYRDPGEDACAVHLGSFRDVEEGVLRGTVGKPIVEEWR